MAVKTLRLMTWNVNGLRACVQRLQKRNLAELLEDLSADIICLQETKMTRSELDEEFVRPPGFDAFYSFCRTRSGYSGVVTFTKSGVTPVIAAEEGLTGTWKVEDAVGHYGSDHRDIAAKLLNELESEGRCVITDHQAFILINVYCPAVRDMERLEYKLAFHELLQDRVRAIQTAGRRVIVVGDINIAHRELDHCEPGPTGNQSFSEHPCRQWMERFVHDSDSALTTENGVAMIDTFRHFHPNEAKAYTCWSMVTAARQTNYGTRIDYILVDRGLLDDSVLSCSIESEQLGSDHCPVVCSLVMQIDDNLGTTNKTATLCAKNYVEFAGKQQTIKTFFVQPQGSESVPQLCISHANTGVKNAVPGSQNAQIQKATVSKSPNRQLLGKTRKRGQQTITTFFHQPTRNSSLLSARPSATSDPTTTATQKQIFKWTNPRQVSPSNDLPAVTDDKRGPNGGLAELIAMTRLKRHSDGEQQQSQWKQVLSGQPPLTPSCYCGLPTVKRSVLKTNDNWGRKFYVCTKPAGEKGNPDARCEFFQWADSNGRKKRKL